MSSEAVSQAAAPQSPAAGGSRRAWLAAAAVLFAAALGTRFVDLGSRPLHHDESIHAFQSYTLSRDGNWRYDPAYHGPFLYYANALVYKILGVSNVTARLLPAVFGLILIGFAWPLSRWIGRGAALAYAILVLLSPHFTYFSRFIREDLYSLVFTLSTILAFRMYLETNRARWLTLAAVAFALAGVTKENAYMTGVLFVLFGVFVFAERVLAQRPVGAAAATAARETADWTFARWRPLFTAALVFLIIWVVMYTAFLRYREDWLAIPKAVKYWIGQHTIARIPGPWYYYFPQLAYYETAILLAALFFIRRAEVRKDPFIRAVACVVFALGLFAEAQVLVSKSPAPALRLIPGLVLAVGLAGAVWLLSRPAPEPRADPFLRFLVYWALASLAIYGWAREKVPWLTVHPLLPLTILAAIGAADLWRDRKERLPRAALAGMALLLVVNTSGMYLACFRYGAYDVEREPLHGEYLAYVQTTDDLVRAVDEVKKAQGRVPAGQSVVTVTGEGTWPLTWYLRDLPTTWVPTLETATTPLIIADWNAEGTLEKQLADRYTAKRLPIRAWWFPDDFWKQPLKTRLRWWLFHELWFFLGSPPSRTPIGSQDAMLFIRKDLESGEGQLAPLEVAVRDTSGRDYPSDAKVVPAARDQGAFGSGPGEFAEPRGVAADSRGNIYIADTKNSRIQVFDATGRPVAQWGSKGGNPGQFNEPCGVTVDARGEIWVADTWNFRVVHLAPDGRFIGVLGPPGENLFGPRAVVTSGNFVYVADTGNKRIVRFDREGHKVSEWGGNGSGPGQFVEPVGIAADAAGNIYVADTGNRRVQIFDPEGTFQRQFRVFGWKDFYTEPYIAVGPSDTVFVTDSWGTRVAQYDLNGSLQRSWRAAQDWKLPTGIALDPFGHLTVADRGTNRVFSWSLDALLR